MTIHHRGRCTYDPKVMSITTPGPQAYSNNSGLVGKTKIKGGSLFGESKTQRSQLGKKPHQDALIQPIVTQNIIIIIQSYASQTVHPQIFPQNK